MFLEICIRLNWFDLIGSGAPRSIVEEPLGWAEEYPIEWREPRFNLAELAVLRWVEGYPLKKLASIFGKTECAICNHCRELNRKDFNVPGLSPGIRTQILDIHDKTRNKHAKTFK